MKSTGIVRKVDELGRVVIPVALRKALGISVQDPLEVFIDKDKIILKKYEPRMACMVTGKISEDNLILQNGEIVISPDAIQRLLPAFEEYLKK